MHSFIRLLLKGDNDCTVADT